MGAGVTKSDNNVKTSLHKGIKYTDTRENNGNIYSTVTRKDFKLNSEVMAIFTRYNNFSCDTEEGTKKPKLITIAK
jgi:hypothetical protein